MIRRYKWLWPIHLMPCSAHFWQINGVVDPEQMLPSSCSSSYVALTKGLLFFVRYLFLPLFLRMKMLMNQLVFVS